MPADVYLDILDVVVVVWFLNTNIETFDMEYMYARKKI